MTVKEDVVRNVEGSDPYGYASAPYASASRVESPNAPLVVTAEVLHPVPVVIQASNNQQTHTATVPYRIRKDMGRSPVQLNDCPFCHESGITRVKDYMDINSWLFAGCCCVWGFVPCGCLPFCMKNMQTSEQRCRHCNNIVGKMMGFEG